MSDLKATRSKTRNRIAASCALVFALLGIGWFVGQRLLANTLPAPRMARAVPVEYYVSLPTGWRSDHTYPIVVTIEGVGHDFARNHQAFVRARRDRPFIIVTPFVRSNGNDPRDLAAVIAIVKEVQQDDGGQPKFFLTGFSAGGHLAWQIVFRHPELLAGAVPAAANFRGRGISPISRRPERVHLPIHAFQGTRDHFLTMMNPQWVNVERTAKRHGYQNLTRTIVPGVGHSPFADEAMDFFSSLMPSDSEESGSH